jgi:hypothetical protein
MIKNKLLDELKELITIIELLPSDIRRAYFDEIEKENNMVLTEDNVNIQNEIS